MIPPKAKKIPHRTEIHGRVRTDDYFWLRDRTDPDTKAYLFAENAYAEEAMREAAPLQKRLFEEMQARMPEADISVPVQKGEYFYYQRIGVGMDYPVFARRRESMDAPEEVLLDQNELAAQGNFFGIGKMEVSPDHTMLAYSFDPDGGERYILRIKDLRTGDIFAGEAHGVFGKLVWTNDSRRLLYMILDEKFRPHRVQKHTIGTELGSADMLLYVEDNERCFVSIGKTRSERYILIASDSKIMREVRYLPAADGAGEPAIFQPRRDEHDYYVEHHPAHGFFIMTNRSSSAFEIMRTPEGKTGEEYWEPYIGADPTAPLEGIHAFEGHLVVRDRKDACARVRAFRLSDRSVRELSFDEPVYAVSMGNNNDFYSTKFFIKYSTMRTPTTVLSCDMNFGSSAAVHREEVRDTDLSQYESKVVWATVRDGARIPITLAYRKGVPERGVAPVLLYGYGAYGTVGTPASSTAVFVSSRLSLLDRGWVLASAHVRGGGEMGEVWHEEGKGGRKKNSFTDFIDCAEYLIAEGIARRDAVAAWGTSAGGLLMGAIANMRPDLFRAIVAEVPFVDTLSTMLDPGLAWTINEYDEWGNPKNPGDYEYIASYSPYDNVHPQAYPAMLITAGWNDPRVSYWEPAKWAAKLRAMKTDDNVLLLKTDMAAGHFGAGKQKDALSEAAFAYAFLLKVVGMGDGNKHAA